MPLFSPIAERGALALSGLLGAPEGRAVRRMVHDVDTAKTIFEIAQHKVPPRPKTDGGDSTSIFTS